MFYSTDSSYSSIASQIAGEGVHCFRSISLTGRLPFFLLEIPRKEQPSWTDAVLMSGLSDVKSTLSQLEKTLNDVCVSFLYHGAITGENDWQCHRISAVWRGEWTQDTHESMTNRFDLVTGQSVYFWGEVPEEPELVNWEKVL
ncbi:MAG: hypothetical protein NT086_14435 [Proteobacteria bacterium]|nr:hypothetical protein [Pseudomonadota bacterium]